MLVAEWRVTSLEDNSGVFVRFPPLGNRDPEHDWKLAVERGYEVQIDERGHDPERNVLGSMLHLTGAIYGLAPARVRASRAVGEWNTFEIEARGRSIRVDLNGTRVSETADDASRPLRGHVGLQMHHSGSRVQFRKVAARRL